MYNRVEHKRDWEKAEFYYTLRRAPLEDLPLYLNHESYMIRTLVQQRLQQGV